MAQKGQKQEGMYVRHVVKYVLCVVSTHKA